MAKNEELKKLAGKGKGLIGEFKEFIMRGNVMDMAVGVIIGAAFKDIVDALTTDFINPLIDGIGGTEVAGKIAIYGGQYLNWGHFVTAVLNFLIIALVLFFLLKGFNKIASIGKKEEKAEEEAPAIVKTDETILLEEIRDILKKESKK